MDEKEMLQKKLSTAKEKVLLLEKMIEKKSRELFEKGEENESLAMFATNNPFPVVRIDKEGLIVMSNMAANSYFNEEKLRGKPWIDYVDMNQARLDISKGYIQHDYDVGDRKLLFCYKNLPDVNCINVYGFDITERKKYEKELEEERARHMHSQKMAVLGEMAGGMAHELNTPLGMLTLSLDQIQTCFHKNKPEMFEEIISEMKTTIGRMGHLINGFKTFSRDTNENDFTFVSSEKLMKDCIEICKMSLREKDIEFLYPQEVKDLSFECNPTEMSQVIINLIQNARDAIEGMDKAWINLDIEIEDELVIKVSDAGDGIPLEVQNDLFTPFFTTKEIGKGTGLGLSIIKGIVDAHKGEIYVDNDAANTTFVVKIPLIQNIGVML